jgi:hypothetical protein
MSAPTQHTLVMRSLASKLKGEGGKVSSRAECIARMTFLMPGLTDRALSALLLLAEQLAVNTTRSMNSSRASVKLATGTLHTAQVGRCCSWRVRILLWGQGISRSRAGCAGWAP